MRGSRRIAPSVAACVFAIGIALTWIWANRAGRIVAVSQGCDVILGAWTSVRVEARSARGPTIRANGELILRERARESVTVQTAHLILTATGPATVVLSARDSEPGAQFAVLEGHVHAQRAYVSRFGDQFDVAAGQVLLLNRSIDLVETEKMRGSDAPGWTEKYLGR
jgi:hypothetical protein